MKKRLMLSILLIVAAGLVLFGCAHNQGSADKEADPSQVTIGFSSEPTSWDPCSGYGTTGPIIFSTLLEVDGNNELVNDLATGYSVSEDATTWTFTLREDARFSDGEKLTAEDVAFTYTTAKNAASYVDLTMLESVTAKDAFTVEFKLNKPMSTLAMTVSEIGIVPAHAYGTDFGEKPIGSGPYKLAQWDKGQQFILEVNEEYYGEASAIKRAVFLVQPDEDARFAAAKSGEVDIAITSATIADNELPGMTLTALKSVDNRGITLPLDPDTGKTTPEGHKLGNDVTSDIAIRQALAYGLDRKAIASEALGGYASPAYTENDGMPWWNAESVITTDIAQAQKLLTDGGWTDSDGDGIREKNGQKAEFNLLYFAGDSMRQAVAMAAASQAKENLGIAIKVEGVSSDEMVKRMFSEPVLMAWGSANPITSYMLFHSSNAAKEDFYNPENFKNTTVDAYLDQALNAASVEDSYAFWQKAQWDGTTGTSMKGEVPWVFLVNMDHLYYVKDGLDIGEQKLHAHGDAWPLVANLREWRWQ